MKNIIKQAKENYKLIAGILIVGLFIGFVFGNSSHKNTNTSTDESTHEHMNTPTHQLWTCSMHPQIKQEKPGQCPICAMDLIPLQSNMSDEEGVDPNEIHMSEAAIKLAQIQTVKVKKEYSNKEVYLLGKVKPDERNISELTARFGGRIEKLYTNFTGQNVVKGEKLATIYSPELVTAQKELLESMEYKESNPAFYTATRNKLKLWDLTEAQIDDIETKGEPQNYFEVLSPISGTVTNRYVSIGDYIKEGSTLFQVINLKKVWLMFEAYESDLPWLHQGDMVEFTVQSLPGETFTGKVTFIDPFLNAKTRVANVRVEVDNSKLKLKPEMFANGIIKPKSSGKQKELMIPKTAVLWTGKRSIVYVKIQEREHNSFIYREITLGAESGDFYLVKEGLAEGEEIATNGVFKIDAAAQLEGKTSMMNPQSDDVSPAHDHSKMTVGSMDSKHQSHHQPETHLKHEKFHVSGNCEMCKSTIETAALALPGINKVNWDMETKELQVSFDENKSNLSDIHKAIAAAGYDTDKETALKETYDKLPPCCQYTRASNTTKYTEQAMFSVSGNCDMCKSTIEAAAGALDGVSVADWNMETKQMHVTFNKNKVSLDEIHKAIAAAGYDTDKAKANNETYENLPGCCQYTRASGTSTTNHMEHAMFKVSGNCDMCKSTIEAAAGALDGVSVTDWNMETKQMHVSFNKNKVSLDEIHKAIAAAGYDTDKVKANNETYENLPGCCQYDRAPAK